LEAGEFSGHQALIDLFLAMRLILSRKGFDSDRGGAPSPIFTSGTMVSLPIPSKKSNIPYNQVSKAGMNLGQIVGAMPACGATSSSAVHLDPDLEINSLQRGNGWRRCFGQANAAQGHLAKQGIGKDDLFLFFGLFRHVDVANITSIMNGKMAYLSGSPVHVLFGWLLVDYKIDLQWTPDQSPSWLAYHPHVKHQSQYLKKNTVYIAKDTLGSLDPSLAGLPGGGAFDQFKPGLLLSDPTKQSCSAWKLPDWFMRHTDDPTKRLTYHPPVMPKSRQNRWTNLSNGFCQLQTVGQGQEFVLDCDHYHPCAKPWAVNILSLAIGNFR
jgi:Nucleotide modification associated domain 3